MKDLLIVGGGMVSHRLVETLASRGAAGQFRITLLTEEPRPPYDRVSMSKYFEAGSAEPLLLATPGWYAGAGVEVRVNTQVRAIDRAARKVTAASGETFGYGALVLTTGSRPFVPPVPGSGSAGCFVYRTLCDLDAIGSHVRSLPGPVTGAVIGGGLLGLEAAGALRGLGVDTHVVELAPRLMPAQVDEAGGRVLLGHIEGRGLTVHCGTKTEAIETGVAGTVARLRLSSETAGEYCLDAQVVVFSAGIRPRDDLAAACGLPAGPRGGFLVDSSCRTADPAIWAAGECAAVEGVTYGLVAPGYSMADVVASQLLGSQAAFARPGLATKLKLLDVDVASFGDAHATGTSAREVRFEDPVAGTYSKLVVGEDGRTLLGGILIGDAARYQALAPMVGRRLPRPPRELIGVGGSSGTGSALTVTGLPDEALICTCNSVDKGTICSAIRDGAHTVSLVKKQTKAGTGCGSCVPSVEQLRRAGLTAAGAQVSDALCEHFPFSRAQLYNLVRLRGYRSFGELIAAHGQGLGCEICRPAVASILASRTGEYVLGGEQAALQDTNDHLLANIQKNGTYSVVPRIPGGEISPAKLAVLAAVAADFGLYVKITGAQRIGLLGARAEQLPAIWRRLTGAGFESGHAYGKAFRTMKSCVGSAWCRYGVQDSVGLAIRLELRYRGLRSPHKIKGAVSGCSRECAEAQGKDIGVIATEKGWNLYAGGNGGYRPAHAELFAQDLDEQTVIRYIDRILLYYISTADRLERTASWLRRLDGGITRLRQVVIDDSLGLCAEWDTHMQALADGYECEWKRTLEDPVALANFVSFVNDPGRPDPDIAFVTERGQPRPLTLSLAGRR